MQLRCATLPSCCHGVFQRTRWPLIATRLPYVLDAFMVTVHRGHTETVPILQIMYSQHQLRPHSWTQPVLKLTQQVTIPYSQTQPFLLLAWTAHSVMFMNAVHSICSHHWLSMYQHHIFMLKSLLITSSLLSSMDAGPWVISTYICPWSWPESTSTKNIWTPCPPQTHLMSQSVTIPDSSKCSSNMSNFPDSHV